MSPADFESFVAVDWTGARGQRHRAIQVAVAPAGNAAPMIVPPPDGKPWSRLGVMDWVRDSFSRRRALIGFDFSFSLPYLDRGAYLPGTDLCAEDVQTLWAEIDARCANARDAYAGPLLDDPAVAAHFLRPGLPAPEGYRRFRVTEHACIDQQLGRAETAFHLIGASQVGLASFAGIRALAHLAADPCFTIWPFDPPGSVGPVVVELFCRAFLIKAGAGGRKIRDLDALNNALAALGSQPFAALDRLDDNMTDALVSAAGMRAIASQRAYWTPAGLSDRVRATEGWVFGVQ